MCDHFYCKRKSIKYKQKVNIAREFGNILGKCQGRNGGCWSGFPSGHGNHHHGVLPSVPTAASRGVSPLIHLSSFYSRRKAFSIAPGTYRLHCLPPANCFSSTSSPEGRSKPFLPHLAGTHCLACFQKTPVVATLNSYPFGTGALYFRCNPLNACPLTPGLLMLQVCSLLTTASHSDGT